MSAFNMLDMCVHYIARRHHLLTDVHVEILDKIWDMYEPSMPPLPPSPPPERQHVRFDYERPDNEQKMSSWPCDPYHYEEEREMEADALWYQIPQGVPVSDSIQQEYEREYEEYEQQLPCCSDYLRRSAYESEEPVIDLTCDKASCEYGCDSKHESSDAAYTLPPIESCLYGCAFSCGATQGQDCIAEFDAEGNQLPPVVASVVQAAIESDDEMPPLIDIGSRSAPKGWSTPQKTQIVTDPPAPTKAPKAKSIFPYNHHLWPSPRAKVLVRSLLGRRAKDVLNVETLTHDACMRYLARHYGLSDELLLKTSIFELHNPERVAWTRDSPKPYMSLPPICGCCYCRNGHHRW